MWHICSEKKLTFLNYAQRILSHIDIMLSTVHYQLIITRKMIWISLTRELIQHRNEKDDDLDKPKRDKGTSLPDNDYILCVL